LLQQVAGDDARGDTTEAWDNARALFDTITDLELADPDLSSGRLLFRLFHEQGVRLESPRALADKCTCSEEKLATTLRAMPRDEILSLAYADGMIAADCQFCGRLYRFEAKSL
jgi:molecular chaperone Hsp33